ncbi:MAG TPA: ABC transporter substrate-binding protein [Bordetella sp.]|jgi:putative spermidine/putrescine transport system substrate-binding protein|nr:ABC transporter substrate-binding protein [Bordetella sp.]
MSDGFRKSRRTLLTAAAAATLSAPFVRANAASKVLYINSWGGVWTRVEEEAFAKPFTKETGIEVRFVTPVSYAKMKAQVESGNYEWDVTALGAAEWMRAYYEGLVEPLDRTVVDPSKLYPNAIVADGLDFTSLGNVLCYREDKYPNGGPKNWADYWDVQKFPGPRAMSTQATRVLAYALLADGVPHDKIYPLDVDRAFRKLDQIKPHVKVWWTQGSQAEQLLRDGEVYMNVLWSSRPNEVRKSGVPIGVVWDGALVVENYYGVIKGSPNKAFGWEFIKFVADAKRQADWAKGTLYGPANPDAYKLLPPDVLDALPGSESHAKLIVRNDAEWEGKNAASITERFTAWLAA